MAIFNCRNPYEPPSPGGSNESPLNGPSIIRTICRYGVFSLVGSFVVFAGSSGSYPQMSLPAVAVLVILSKYKVRIYHVVVCMVFAYVTSFIGVILIDLLVSVVLSNSWASDDSRRPYLLMIYSYTGFIVSICAASLFANRLLIVTEPIKK